MTQLTQSHAIIARARRARQPSPRPGHREGQAEEGASGTGGVRERVQARRAQDRGSHAQRPERVSLALCLFLPSNFNVPSYAYMYKEEG